MLGGKRRQTTDRLLEDTRKRYAFMTEEKRLPVSAARAFDDRYYAALKAGMDIQRFLQAESAALDELECRSAEKEETLVSDVPASETNETEEERESFIDRVTRELYRRIEGYPSAVLPPGASFDMEKLAGMLLYFGREHWPVMEGFLRTSGASNRMGTRMALESLILEHCLPGTWGVPACFDRYVGALHDGQENRVEREEQLCIVTAARFLQGMKKEVFLLRTQAKDPEEEKVLQGIEGFLLSAVENFRMKDLGLLR
ncbi:MAG: hypothetical protein JW760_10090 [Spirochaetales bacterium]|nr:hypothetical protein [Spirochaetales bacterium]